MICRHFSPSLLSPSNISEPTRTGAGALLSICPEPWLIHAAQLVLHSISPIETNPFYVSSPKEDWSMTTELQDFKRDREGKWGGEVALHIEMMNVQITHSKRTRFSCRHVTLQLRIYLYPPKAFTLILIKPGIRQLLSHKEFVSCQANK